MVQDDAWVSALHLHPVKSCRRVEVDHAVVGERGFVGDREWQVVSPDGIPLTQREQPSLTQVQPSLLEGGIRLSADGLPDLEVQRPPLADRDSWSCLAIPVRVGDAGDEAAVWLSRAVGVPARLLAITAGYSRRVPIGSDAVADVDEAMGRAVVEVFADEVSLADLTPLLVATEASFEFLVERASEPFEMTRFRPNVVISGTRPWEEDAWRTFACGSVNFTGGFPMPRCSLPQIDQETGERHREPARVLKAHRFFAKRDDQGALKAGIAGNALFGIGCRAAPVGATVRVGDAVEILEVGEPVVPADAFV